MSRQKEDGRGGTERKFEGDDARGMTLFMDGIKNHAGIKWYICGSLFPSI
jgi:hypothetical protein